MSRNRKKGDTSRFRSRSLFFLARRYPPGARPAVAAGRNSVPAKHKGRAYCNGRPAQEGPFSEAISADQKKQGGFVTSFLSFYLGRRANKKSPPTFAGWSCGSGKASRASAIGVARRREHARPPRRRPALVESLPSRLCRLCELLGSHFSRLSRCRQVV